MQLITFCALNGWDTWACPHQFHVNVENKMLCHEPGISAVIFSHLRDFQGRKLVGKIFLAHRDFAQSK